jgi:aryl-alcohol dehydrogenase-like predicted oxidoreductase
MAESFGYLDGLVKSGTIGGYGVCSNTMSLPTAADHVSLRDTLAACNNKNNLVAIQVPFNLYEREAVQSEMETIADIAEVRA